MRVICPLWTPSSMNQLMPSRLLSSSLLRLTPQMSSRPTPLLTLPLPALQNTHSLLENRMPYTKPDGTRDYKRENRLYNSRPEQIKNRSERTVARREANASGQTHKGDGNDLDHRQPLSKGGSNDKSNLRVVSEGTNRSFSRNSDGSLKNQTSRRERKNR